MRGKVTYRSGRHPSRIGGIVEPVTIGPGEWRELEKALGPLDGAAREAISDGCAILREIASDASVSSADIRATLEAIADEKDDTKLFEAVEYCDAATRAQIDLQVYRMNGSDFWLAGDKTPENVAAAFRAAAGLAAKDFAQTRGKRKQGWQRLAAEYAAQLAAWRGLPTTAHARDEWKNNPSPVVAVLQTLLGIVAPENSAQSESWCVKLLGEINARRP